MIQVFSKEWFERYQVQLLRFANSRVGRYKLHIHGNRSGVGTRKITRIEPHAITWDNGDGTLSAEFRTDQKFSKRLYYGFRPIWWLMHCWDMSVANNLRPALNLGFDTLTAYPQASGGSLTVSGSTIRQTSPSSETLTVIRAGSGTTSYTSSLDVQLQAHDSVVGNFVGVWRSILTFDTSSIGATSTVTAAELSLFTTDKFGGLGTNGYEIVSATPNQTHILSPADHSRVGSTTFASGTYAGAVPGSEVDHTLNSDGRAHIDTGGVTGLAIRLGWDYSGTFTGAWAPGNITYFAWASSDRAGTSEDPRLTVTYTRGFPTSLTGVLLLSSSFTAKTIHATGLGGTLSLGSSINIRKVIAPVAGKEYVYRVYNAADTYLGVWGDVTSRLEFTERINRPGTSTVVSLARSANRTTEVREDLVDETIDPITTESGESLAVTFQTSNTIGEDTDVDLNYNVDIYVHYGRFEVLTTEDGEDILTESGEEILVAVGAPLGAPVFRGFISDYSAAYGREDGVEVTLLSHGFELSHEIIKDGLNTTRTYTAQTHDTIFKSVLDTNPSKMSYDNSSIQSTAVNISPTFRLNTKLEGLQSVFNQTDPGWFWYGNVADNNVYLQERASTPHHTLILGKHIQSIALRRSIEDLRNTIYFVGGDTGGGAILYKKYEDAASIALWRQGVHRITDRRYTVAASAQRYADKIMDRFAGAIYTTTVTIPSEQIEIENVLLGQVVGFANFGNFVDDVTLQIVGRRYSPTGLTLELGEVLDRQQDIIDNIREDVQGEQFDQIPNAPS